MIFCAGRIYIESGKLLDFNTKSDEESFTDVEPNLTNEIEDLIKNIPEGQGICLHTGYKWMVARRWCLIYHDRCWNSLVLRNENYGVEPDKKADEMVPIGKAFKASETKTNSAAIYSGSSKSWG